jgi:hypothetical protein
VPHGAFNAGERNASAKYPDDRILDDQGNALCWDSSACKHACDELAYFYGTSTNRYGRQLDAYIDKVFALGCVAMATVLASLFQQGCHTCWSDDVWLGLLRHHARSVHGRSADGIYHDESAFSVTAQHGRDFGQIIYNPALPWDGVTVAATTSGKSCSLLPRPQAPCPPHWFVGSQGVCAQACPLSAQGRDPHSGRCRCGQAAPNSRCQPGLSCIDGQCCADSGPDARPHVTGLPSMTGLVRLQHKKELYNRVFKRRGMVVANDPPVTRSFRNWLIEQARLHAATGGKQGGVAVHFAETGEQVRGRVTHLYTPVMLNRCGTEGAPPSPSTQAACVFCFFSSQNMRKNRLGM